MKTDNLFEILNKNATIKHDNQDFNIKFGNRDWRKYVPIPMQQDFQKFPKWAKKAIFILCEIQARTERYREPVRVKPTDLLPPDVKKRLESRSKIW
jgi:hypothetical protein